jgi:hypothetical protein
MPPTRPRELAGEHLAAMLAFAIVVSIYGIGLFVTEFGPVDFMTFHQSGLAFVNAETVYRPVEGRINLNPPSLIALIFAPLARLPLQGAAVSWTLLGLIAVGASMRVIARELDLSHRATIVLASLLMILPGSTFTWVAGQVTWLLLYPTTLAWRAYRHGRDLAAGLWLTPLIAAKPFFLVALVPLGIIVALAAGFSAALVSAASIPVTGWELWVHWFGLSGDVRWLAEPVNASLPGTIARFLATDRTTPVGLRDFGGLSLGVWLLALVIAIGCGILIPRARSDAKWLVALLGAIIVSPLGWLYYLPLCAPAAIAYWRTRPVPALLWAQFAPFVFASLIREPQWAYALAASWYCWGLLAVWVTIAAKNTRIVELR